MGILGECYAEGKGVTKNLDEAVKWFRRGAEMDPAAHAQPNEIFAFRHGVGACRAELGACYDEGKGVARDTQEALKWYQAALDIGFHHVKAAIEKLQTASRK
jgi:TPR repeat protein